MAGGGGAWGHRRRRRGGGGTVPQNVLADVRFRANFGQNSGKLRAYSGKIRENSVKCALFLLVNYFGRDNL